MACAPTTDATGDPSGDRRRWCLGLTSALVVPACALGGVRIHRVGPGERLRNLQDAIHAASSGEVIEIQPGIYHGDVAVIEVPQLTIRGLGAGAVFHADGQHAEGKAMLVVRGDVVVEKSSSEAPVCPPATGPESALNGVDLRCGAAASSTTRWAC